MILAIGTIYQEAEGMQILLTGTYLEVHGSAQGAVLLRSSVLTKILTEFFPSRARDVCGFLRNLCGDK